MDFIDKWREEINSSVTECAKLAVSIKEAELEHALVATGVLWPLRQPVREFDMEAIGAVNTLLGGQAKYVLRTVQGWSDNAEAAARSLKLQMSENSELDAALGILIDQFKASDIFADVLSKHALKDGRGIETDQADGKLQAGDEAIETSEQPSRVFISYARRDGEDLAREIRQRLEREGISVWQDRVKMEGGRDWWLQITDALNQVEFMVLVATPGALQSEIVGKEWHYARQQGVCVYPIKVTAELNFDELPRWMRNVHFYDLELEWLKLIQDLNEECEMPRVPFMVEELADDFVSRSDKLDQLISCLLDDRGDPIATTVALYGTGGYGKTMLAKALCHNDDVRQAFDDGILWISLGEDPGDLTGRVVDLIEVLSGERPGFAGLDAAEARLVQMLADREILIVIDDVWNVAHLKPFIRGGKRCARLITTRNVAALPPKTEKSIEVAAMTRNEAVALLSMGLPKEDSKSLEQLADRLGEWPLLLKLTNSTLRDRVYTNNQPLAAALSYVNKALDKRGLTAFDAHNVAARDQAVSQTLGVSQELLEENERLRYTELAIFPGDVNIPLNVLQMLWGTTGGLDDFETEELCNRLSRLSLLAHFEPNEHYIRLHSILQKYMAQEESEKLPSLHQKLLDAYAANLPGKPRWASLSADESYLWVYLAYHLIGAERGPELVDTVKDLSYLVTKTYLHTANTTEADMLAARLVAPNDSVLTHLHQAFSQSSHLLNQCETLNRVANTLHSRIVHFPGLNDIVAVGVEDLPKPMLTASRRLPDLPDSSLIRALGHQVPVLACAISADGSTAVSMARDTIVRIWDAHTGAERFTLSGHKVVGNSCAINADGTVAVSVTWDGVLKIWDTKSGVERFSIENAHAGPLFRCAVSEDGAMVVTASKDKTLKIWDANTGTERFTLTGHERSVTGCAISGDGSTIVSASPDGTVKIWDANTGTLHSSIQGYEDTETQNPATKLTFTITTSALLSCAISADGGIVVSVLPDGILKVWDAHTGAERFTLRGHSGWVEDCAINADGSLIVSVSNDKTIRGWNGQTGMKRFTLEGHMRTVSGCSLNAEGTILATSSQDKTLKLWDVASIAEQLPRTSHISAAQCCAVSADGSTVIFDSTNNALKLLNAQDIAEHFELKGHMRPISGCAISADGKTIVSASQDRTLKIWEAYSRSERLTLEGHMWAVNDCALSKDESIVVSASEDSTLKVWDAYTGEQRFTLAGHTRGVNGCAISADNTIIVSASADQTLKVWDAKTGAERFTLAGHTAPVNQCDISPDGLYIVSAANDNLLKVWDSQTGQERFTLDEHTGSVSGCAFSPDSASILSASKDNTIKLWDVQTGKCLTTLLVDGPLLDCAWFPDGQHIVAVGGRGTYFLQLLR